MHFQKVFLLSYAFVSNLSKKLFVTLLCFTSVVVGDSFQYNTYNNHGVVGLINMPTARLYDESVHGITYTMALRSENNTIFQSL